MAYTTPRTWVAGEKPTAAQFNAHIRDNIAFLANPPACRVYNSAAQSYPNSSTPSASAFNSERYDTDGMHSTTTNTSRITFTTAGLYVVGGSGAFDPNAGGTRFIGIRLGGATYIATSLHQESASFNGAVTICTVYKFAAGNYIELMFAQTSGSTLNLLATTADSPEFHATWVGIG